MSSKRRDTSPRIPWLEWGRTLFETAQHQDRPILLYLTTSWGHPVHLFELNVLRDPKVLELIHDHYLPVRVDAMDTPDVAERYNQGAWPALCFLTPTGELLHGRTDLSLTVTRQALEQVHQYYRDHREEIIAEIEKAPPPQLPRLRSGLDFTSAASTLDSIRHDAMAWFDTKYHGFGRYPKFPLPDLLLFLLEDSSLDIRKLAYVTLETMRKSPLRDPISGGFHRYCEDESWRNPQYDKILTENMALLEAYLEAYRQTQDEPARKVASGILRDMEGMLGDETGLFYAVLDSDGIPGDRGSFFGWTEKEIRKSVDNETTAMVLITYFGLPFGTPIPGAGGRFSLEERITPYQIAFRLEMTQEEVQKHIEEGIEALHRTSMTRQIPAVESRFFTHVQGQAIKALANAAIFLDKPRSLQRAFEIADLLWIQGRAEKGGMLHEIRGDDADTLYLSDQVEVIHGFLELYRISGRAKDLLRAVQLTEETFEIVGDDQGPGCFDHLMREQEYGALKHPYTPFDANARLSHAVAVIATITRETSWHERAQALVGGLEEMHPPFRMRDAVYGRALRRFVATPPVVDLLTGDGIGEMRRELLKRAPSGTLFRAFDPDQETPWTLMETYPSNGGKARAAVIVDGKSFEPTHDLDLALFHLLEGE
ncbi:MAG: DUF255 domain-containing protein [bacterium]